MGMASLIRAKTVRFAMGVGQTLSKTFAARWVGPCDRRRPMKICVLLIGVFGIQSLVIVAFLLHGQENEVECRRTFLSAFDSYCRHSVRPLPVNFIDNIRPGDSPESPSVALHNIDLCPCIPRKDDPMFKVNYNTSVSWDELLQHQSVAAGSLSSSSNAAAATITSSGRWRPTWCIPRHRIALIVPFSSDREQHLVVFLNNMHPFLRRQLLDYTIIVVEQIEPEKFNRGALLNAGYLEAKSRAATSGGQYDCFIFHDVDLFPEDVHNFYVCSTAPRHMAAYRRGWNYDLLYDGFFGGVTSFRGEHFEQINGFSNAFFGWGGEDDDLLNRVSTHGLQVDARYPKCVSKYGEQQHERDRRNPIGLHKNQGRYYKSLDEYKRDGLNTLNYTLVSYREMSLYSHVSVNLLHDASASITAKLCTVSVSLIVSFFSIRTTL